MKRLLAKIYKKLRLPTNLQLSFMGLLQDKFLVGVTGIIFNAQDEILLVHHTYRHIPWSLPGGYIKGREHPKEGLEREIMEETGFIVSVDSRLKIQTDRDSPRLDICYVGEFISGDFKPNHEVTEAAFFAFDQLPLIMKKQLLMIHKALKLRKTSPQSLP